MVLSGRFFYSAEFRIGRFRHRVSAGFRSEKSYRPPAGRMRFSTVRKVFRFFRTFAEPPAPSVRNHRLSGDTASVSFRRPHFGSGDRVSDCRDAFRLVLAFFSVFGSRSGLFPGRCGCGRLPKIPDLPVRKKAAGHVRRPFYVQGGPESSEGGRNRSAPGTGRNDSRKPKKTPGRAGRHPGNPKPGLPNRNAAGGTKRTPCHPKAGGSGRKGPAAPRKSGKIEKPSEQLKTASGRPVAGTTFRNGNRPKPDAGNDRSETPPNKKIAPREPFVLFFISLPR